MPGGDGPMAWLASPTCLAGMAPWLGEHSPNGMAGQAWNSAHAWRASHELGMLLSEGAGCGVRIFLLDKQIEQAAAQQNAGA